MNPNAFNILTTIHPKYIHHIGVYAGLWEVCINMKHDKLHKNSASKYKLVVSDNGQPHLVLDHMRCDYMTEFPILQQNFSHDKEHILLEQLNV
jgi:hypothetical protein